MSPEVDPQLVLAQASRILYALGIVDAFGHVSCRSASGADAFWMSRSMAPGLVCPADVIEHDFEGSPVSDKAARVFLERFIHAEIYRSRPDVGAIVHSHAPGVIPFTVTSQRVRPIAHTCGFLGQMTAPFDVADVVGDGSDLLVRDAGLGRALAAHLGGGKVVLMRGHGFTAVGSSVPEAVYRAVYTAKNCELQALAMQMGEPKYLSAAEAAACDASTRTQTDRAWNLWVSEFTDFGAG